MYNFIDKFLNLVIITAIGVIIYTAFFTDKPVISTPDLSNENISVTDLSDPVQKKYRGNDYITFVKKGMDVKIIPKAEYKIYAMVMSKKKNTVGIQKVFFLLMT